RVLSRLNSGNAQTFASIAARMARTSAKSMAATAMRARLSLGVELPLGLGVQDGPLALALASGRELAREWIAQPSTGSLPNRRLPARALGKGAPAAPTPGQQGHE